MSWYSEMVPLWKKSRFNFTAALYGHLRNKFNFSEVHESMNAMGSSKKIVGECKYKSNNSTFENSKEQLKVLL